MGLASAHMPRLQPTRGQPHDPVGGSSGRFLTLWLTTLPPVSGGFRGEIAEIVVRS